MTRRSNPTQVLGDHPSRVEVNITQLVELWAHTSISNQGLLLVSHRRQVDKALHLGQVVLSAEPRASATIFSTALD